MPEVPDSNLIRSYVDHELPEDEARAIEALMDADPRVRSMVEFERGLRDRVKAAMHATAPPDVAEKVRGAISTPPVWPDEERNQPWILRNPTRPSYLAVAASLLLVAGAVLFGIFGKPLMRPAPREFTGLSEVTLWLEEEHARCATDPGHRARKAIYREPEVAARELTEHLEAPVLIYDFSGFGFEFVGGGPCMVPPENIESCHLIYRSSLGTHISVFLEADRGQYDLAVGELLTIEVKSIGAGLMWTDGEIVQMLTFCDQRDVSPALQLIDFHSGR